MKLPQLSSRARIALCTGLLFAFFTALYIPGSAARYTAVETIGQEARAAAFAIEIVPPKGVYKEDDLPGTRNEVYLSNTQYEEHIFTIVNHGEVTVIITPAATAWKDSAFTLDTTPFTLQAGEYYELAFTLEGGATGITQTVQDIDLTLTIEQAD